MKKITHYAAAPYLTKILVNRKVKAPFEINTVTKVKLYSNSFKLYRRNYQCNLRAIVRTYYDKQQIFFANIVYSSRIEFLAAPDLKIDAEVEHVMKNVAPKEALFDVLRNKVYTVMQDSGLSPYMISDNCDYQYIEEENDYDDKGYEDDWEEEFDELSDDSFGDNDDDEEEEDKDGGDDDEEDDYFGEEEDSYDDEEEDEDGDDDDEDYFDDEEDFFDPDEIAKENERLEKEASKYTYKWLIDNARKKVEGRELLKLLSDESVCLRFNFTTQAQFFYNFFNFPKYFLPDYVASCNSDFEFILYSLIFGEADNIKSDNNYIPSLYFTWRGTEYYLLKLEKDVFEKIIVEMFIQSFETGRKILKLQPDYILIEDIAGDANVKINDFYALFADPSAEKKEFCNEIHKRIKDCNSLYNLTTLID